MDQYKLNDLMDATKEVVGKETVENLLPAVVQETGSFLFDRGVGILACQIVGSVVPVANNVLLSYKQHRLERNVLNSLRIIQSKQNELEKRMNELLENNPTLLHRLRKLYWII